MNPPFITGTINSNAGTIAVVSTQLTLHDFWGTIKVRWGINRNNYRISPGIYATGSPGPQSSVWVTANYKLSFDHLRKNLEGVDAWILVLDTKGVNVWCAAGKGTFGTRELVKRIEETGLRNIVSHRKIILPQLGATGVSAHQVKELTSAAKSVRLVQDNTSTLEAGIFTGGLQLGMDSGFTVIWGPVRAEDIPAFISSGYKSSATMRKVTFHLYDRIKLVPVDLVNAKYYFLVALSVLLFISGFEKGGYAISKMADNVLPTISLLGSGFLSGLLLTPLLLPWIPGRRFSVKGAISGLFTALILFLLFGTGSTLIENMAWLCIISAVSSFLAMNFTGSSTFTSLSGVKKEMKTAIPVQIVVSGTGLVLYILGQFI